MMNARAREGIGMKDSEIVVKLFQVRYVFRCESPCKPIKVLSLAPLLHMVTAQKAMAVHLGCIQVSYQWPCPIVQKLTTHLWVWPSFTTVLGSCCRVNSRRKQPWKQSYPRLCEIPQFLSFQAKCLFLPICVQNFPLEGPSLMVLSWLWWPLSLFWVLSHTAVWCPSSIQHTLACVLCTYFLSVCHACTSYLCVMHVLLTCVLCMYFSPVCYACTSNLCVMHVILTYMLCMYFLPRSSPLL